jgi:hypothetical protein
MVCIAFWRATNSTNEKLGVGGACVSRRGDALGVSDFCPGIMVDIGDLGNSTEHEVLSVPSSSRLSDTLGS